MSHDTSAPEDAWGDQSTPLGLTARDIHIWRARLERPPLQIERLLRFLSHDEACRASRFVLDRDRGRYIAAHGILRLILSRYTDDEPHQLCFHTGHAGKPHLAPPHNDGLTFNMSHSENVVLIAIAWRRDLGIDVERVRTIPEAAAIVCRMFPPAERDLYEATPAAEREGLFFRLWTRHEASLKASGAGLSGSKLQPGSELAVRADQPEGMSDWEVSDLAPYPGYVGAVAVKGIEYHLRYRDFS